MSKEKLDITVVFELELIIDEWGKYSKGDRDFFTIRIFDEDNGLVRYPIDKRWKIISYEIH